MCVERPIIEHRTNRPGLHAAVGYIPARRICVGVVIGALLAPHWIGGPHATGEGPTAFIIALSVAVIAVLVRALATGPAETRPCGP